MSQRKLTQVAFKKVTHEVPTGDISGASPSHKALSKRSTGIAQVRQHCGVHVTGNPQRSSYRIKIRP
jgi:hypothetical protein